MKMHWGEPVLADLLECTRDQVFWLLHNDSEFGPNLISEYLKQFCPKFIKKSQIFSTRTTKVYWVKQEASGQQINADKTQRLHQSACYKYKYIQHSRTAQKAHNGLYK